MNVKELIENLKGVSPDAEVKVNGQAVTEIVVAITANEVEIQGGQKKK